MADTGSAGNEQDHRRRLTTTHGVAILVGTVIGAGIFKVPALVASNAADATAFLLLWLTGGIVSLIGALVYAELTTSQSDEGGEYTILARAWGPQVGFLFAWARLAVIQTGAIAAVAFVLGDYLQALLPLGRFGPALYGAGAIAIVTGVNLRGARVGAGAQVGLQVLLIAGLGMLVAGGLAGGEVPVNSSSAESRPTVAGLAMVFILLTYGGWNEAAYLAGETKDARRTMVRILVIGTIMVTAIYLLVNLAYLRALGLDGVAASSAVGADAAQVLFGSTGATLVAMLVAVAAFSTLNGTVFTGARTSYALGRDFPRLAWLAAWHEGRSAPTGALLVQAAISLLLVAGGAFARDGFAAMVEFTAPAFWLFLLLTGLALFRFRRRGAPAGFRVPLYPVVPALFCLAALYMLHASLVHTGLGAPFGVAVLAAGVPVLLWARRPVA